MSFFNIPLAWYVKYHLLRQVWLGNISRRHWLWFNRSYVCLSPPEGVERIHWWLFLVMLYRQSNVLNIISGFRVVISSRNAKRYNPRGELDLNGDNWINIITFLRHFREDSWFKSCIHGKNFEMAVKVQPYCVIPSTIKAFTIDLFHLCSFFVSIHSNCHIHF